MKKTLFALLSITFIACAPNHKTRPVSSFNLDAKALSDSTVVELIFFSHGPFDDEIKGGYYRHAIVINLSSQDTLNVLTFPSPDLDHFSATKTTYIYRDRPSLNKIVAKLEEFEFSEEIQDDFKKANPDKMTWAVFDKVYVNPNSPGITDNSFKTVIGSLDFN